MGLFEFFMITSMADDDRKVLPKRKKGLQNAYIRQNKWGEYEIVFKDKIISTGRNLRAMEDILEWVKKQ